MFCRNCGNNLDEGVSFCAACGTPVQAAPTEQPAPQPAPQPVQQPVYQQPVYQQPTYQQPTYQNPAYQQNPTGYAPVVFVQEMPMKWYKFLIYFSLFASAVLNLINGIGMLTGTIYQGQADLVYAVFDGLKGLDTFMGVFALALAGFAIFVRFQLSGYKKIAPRLLLILYIGVVVFDLSYIIGLGSVLPEMAMDMIDTTSFYSSMISSAVFAVVNFIYFKKRAHLFVN